MNVLLFLFIFLCPLLFSGNSLANQDLSALLSFRFTLLDPSNSLSSWINSTNPCISNSSKWLGVTCNPVTHRVTRLALNNLNLTGPIHPLSLLTHLTLLSLSHNNLSGTFPTGLSGLQWLDLSHNMFTGNIVSWWPEIVPASVSEFNISGNQLSGEIPAWMSRFPASSFAGNAGLCGRPLPRKCSFTDDDGALEIGLKVVVRPSGKGGGGRFGGRGRGRKGKEVGLLVFIIIVSIGVAIVGLAIAVSCFQDYRWRKRARATWFYGLDTRHVRVRPQSNPQSGGGSNGDFDDGPRPSIWPKRGASATERKEDVEMVVFEGCIGIRHVDNLLDSTAEMLGKGHVGTTYKMTVEGGGEVAVVKRVREKRKVEEVEGWLRVLAGLRHPNVASLRAFCNYEDELLLVYDFFTNGSLHSLLHGNRGPGRTRLEWTTRLKIASGTAEGLAFLHNYNGCNLFHGNLTSTNILVDHLGNACISDIGLSQLLHAPFPSDNSYKAPELVPKHNEKCRHGHNAGIRKKFTQKCDVYSFGLVLLEILTGKMPTDKGATSLVNWVKGMAIREEWNWEVLDIELLSYYRGMEEEMLALMEVALLCLAPMPGDRPEMSVVHLMIRDITTKVERKNAGSPTSIVGDSSSNPSPPQSEIAAGSS